MKVIKKLLEYVLVILLFCILSSKLNFNSFFKYRNIPVDGLLSRGFSVDYNILSPISPVIYNYSNSIVNIDINSVVPMSGKIIVEFEGITYPYEESFNIIGKKEFNIKPVFKLDAKDMLKKPRDVQLKIEIRDLKNRQIYVKTENIRFLSIYDMVWKLEDGKDLSYLIASWVTPENSEIKRLLRKSVDFLGRYPIKDDNKKKKYILNAIPGYQFPNNVDKYDVVYAQIAAIFDSIKEDYNVRYVFDIETGRNERTQIIKYPEEVLKERSGLCIETVVTMASAVEAAGMNPIIFMTESHAVLGVETYESSGKYIFIETTDLTTSSAKAFRDGNEFYEKHKESNDVVIINIKKSRGNNIKPFE